MQSYDWWQRALTGEKIGGALLPLHEGSPELGFYRHRSSKGGGYVGVAIFPHPETGEIIALRDNKQVDADEEWSWCAKYPISEENYRTWESTGKWLDEADGLAASLAPASQDIGANNPPTDEAELLKGQIEAASAGALEYTIINSDEAAAKAQGLRSRLLELSGEADKKREALKRPFFEAGKAIDLKFQPLMKAAKAAADAIRSAISEHETRQLKARQAEEAARQAEIERLRQEAIKASPDSEPTVILPVEPPAPAPVQTQVRGAYGRAATKKMVKIAKVTDYDKAYQGLKTHPEMKALIDTLAQRAINAGLTLDGVEIEEKIDVR